MKIHQTHQAKPCGCGALTVADYEEPCVGGPWFRKGDVVRGLGRNGRPWNPRPVGDVTRVVRGYVRVQWRDCVVEDDMRQSEVEHVR